MDCVERAYSGLLLKADPNLGLLVHSPFTGLTHAVHPSEASQVANWLTTPGHPAPSNEYTDLLGAGWAVPTEEGKYIRPHLLPNIAAWSTLPAPSNPIVINWLITGRCPLACKYCWSEDLMRQDEREPDRDGVVQIAKTILEYKPLVVVLTGGDPLFSPFLSTAIEALYGKCGIVVDTSGYTFNNKHLDLLKRYNVAIRVSVDSERPKINEAQRVLYKKYPNYVRSGRGATEAALSTICECLDAGLSVTVQSVATKKTANDLLSLGDKLYRLGVHSWRVGKVAPSESSMKGFLQLVGGHTDKGKKVKGPRSEGPYEYVFKELKDAFNSSWKDSMTVQVLPNNVPNAVVLVGPDGTFYTESNTAVRKVVLDSEHHKSPSNEAIRSKVNMLAHAERYLNLTA